jgi:hypothetical protein
LLIQGNITRLNKNSKSVTIAWRKDLNYWEEEQWSRGQRYPRYVIWFVKCGPGKKKFFS